jgi:hypothetical protein
MRSAERSLCGAGALTRPSLKVSRETPARVDAPRFRAAIRGGPALLSYPTERTTLLGIAADGEVGVQFDDLVGLVASPGVGALFGSDPALVARVGFLVDFTFDDRWSVGLGPEIVHYAIPIVLDFGTSRAAADGTLVGGKLRAAWHPIVKPGSSGARRKALSLGLELGIASGPVVDLSATARSTPELGISPKLNVGYTVF